MKSTQTLLFPEAADAPSEASASTFVRNMRLPVHRWFRYSAGFSAEWAERVIHDSGTSTAPIRVFDPFAGSATTLVAAEMQRVECRGIDAHPFVARIARAKLQWRSSPDAYLKKVGEMRRVAKAISPDASGYPALIYKCYDEQTLNDLDSLRRAYEEIKDSPESELAWLTLVAILRATSKAGTAQWQYVLPRKQKASPRHPFVAFDETVRMFHFDMVAGQSLEGPRALFAQSDARTCDGVPDNWATLVLTSPPYPNNYDYADATRLEMSFMREVAGWGDLQEKIRRHLVRSCSQHVPDRAIDLEEVLQSPELAPIRSEIAPVCRQLAEVRKTKGGKKTYHLMIACYFRDLSLVWRCLRRVRARLESLLCHWRLRAVWRLCSGNAVVGRACPSGGLWLAPV